MKQEHSSKFKHYVAITRLNRPIGIWLLMWPTLWALWLAAHGEPQAINVIVFILGTILMRSAGCVMNDFADQNIDGFVERTKNRPLATKSISKKEALTLFAILAVVAFSLTFFLNRLAVQLAFIALFLAVLYPFTKRVTSWPQLFLGLAYGFAVPMAYAAEQYTIPMFAWFLYAIVILWSMIYDTMYAMVDKEDDLKIGVKSMAILFGKYDRLNLALMQIVMITMLVIVGIWQHLAYFYYLSVIVVAGFFIYQQFLIRHRDKSSCFKAFLNNSYVGMIIFIGIFVSFFLF